MPVHWHAPYNYWQWPFEGHTKAEGAHDLHDVTNPVWVDAKTSNPTKAGTKVIKPTAAMVKAYNESLDPNSALSVRIREEYKAYLKAKASGKPAAAAPVSEVDEEGALVN